jgi:hypothetical protein
MSPDERDGLIVQIYVFSRFVFSCVICGLMIGGIILLIELGRWAWGQLQ